MTVLFFHPSTIGCRHGVTYHSGYYWMKMRELFEKNKLSWTTGQERAKAVPQRAATGTFTKHYRRQPTEPNAWRKRESGKRGGAGLEAPHAHCGVRGSPSLNWGTYIDRVAQPSYYFESTKKLGVALTCFFFFFLSMILFLDFQNPSHWAVRWYYTLFGMDQVRSNLSFGHCTAIRNTTHFKGEIRQAWLVLCHNLYMLPLEIIYQVYIIFEYYRERQAMIRNYWAKIANLLML